VQKSATSIACCAPTCADDIALAGSNPLDIQILVNIASDYSAREAYTKICSTGGGTACN
jgi:hypothetical protein